MICRGTATLLAFCLFGDKFAPRRKKMLRTVFAMAVAGLMFAAFAGTSQATPIAPLAAGVTADGGHATQVWWRRWHHHGWCYWHPRRC